MPYRPLTIACPTCGSGAVFYTCSPSCCFNHVCDACHTTFELATEATGGTVPAAERGGLDAIPPEDSTAPHAQCPRCDALAVRLADAAAAPGPSPATQDAACGACFARLALRLENVTPAA